MLITALSASPQNCLLLFLFGQSSFRESTATLGRMVNLWHHDTEYDNTEHIDTLHDNESMIFSKDHIIKSLQKGKKLNTTSVCSKIRTLITVLSASLHNYLLLFLPGQSSFWESTTTLGMMVNLWHNDTECEYDKTEHSDTLHNNESMIF
jgi:hypothetical protein